MERIVDGRKGSIVTNVSRCCWPKYRLETITSQGMELFTVIYSNRTVMISIVKADFSDEALSPIVVLTGLPIGYSVIVALTGLPIGYSVIVALTGLPIGYSVIVALTGLPIGYSVIVALTGLPIGYSVIVDTV